MGEEGLGRATNTVLPPRALLARPSAMMAALAAGVIIDAAMTLLGPWSWSAPGPLMRPPVPACG